MVAGMARANRLRVDGGVLHLTHRSHNRAFLLKLALPSVGEDQSLLDIAPAPRGDRLFPCGAQPLNRVPKLVGTQRVHLARIQFFPATRGFLNAFRTGVFMTVGRQRIQEPCSQGAALHFRQVGNRISNLGD